MVYEYQKETLEYLKELVGKLENITESRMSLKIGYMRFYWWNGNKYILRSGDLHLRLNYDRKFSLINDDGYISHEFDVIDDDDYIRFNENLFLKLNDWIDKIYSEKRDREEFHRKLNLELRALNKSLE